MLKFLTKLIKYKLYLTESLEDFKKMISSSDNLGANGLSGVLAIGVYFELNI